MCQQPALITQIQDRSVQQEHKSFAIYFFYYTDPKQCFGYDDEDVHKMYRICA